MAGSAGPATGALVVGSLAGGALMGGALGGGTLDSGPGGCGIWNGSVGMSPVACVMAAGWLEGLGKALALTADVDTGGDAVEAGGGPSAVVRASRSSRAPKKATSVALPTEGGGADHRRVHHARQRGAGAVEVDLQGARTAACMARRPASAPRSKASARSTMAATASGTPARPTRSERRGLRRAGDEHARWRSRPRARAAR